MPSGSIQWRGIRNRFPDCGAKSRTRCRDRPSSCIPFEGSDRGGSAGEICHEQEVAVHMMGGLGDIRVAYAVQFVELPARLADRGLEKPDTDRS